jgi:hypothetical protein
MSWLFGNKSNSSSSSEFGISTSSQNKVKDAIKLDEIDKKLSGTNDKIQAEMRKYKQIAQLNKKLTESYLTNYYAMIDVSKLLKDYAEIFDKLSAVLKKYEQIEISPIDMEHLKSITRSKLDELTGEFNKQSSTIKSLYSKYNMSTELNKISTVDPQTKELASVVNATMEKMKSTTVDIDRERKEREDRERKEREEREKKEREERERKEREERERRDSSERPKFGGKKRNNKKN